MITGIIPFGYLHGIGQNSGSTFLRVDRLVANNRGFEKWVHGKKYDNLIFQKAYWLTMMKVFDGPKILDICDPDWMKYNVNIRETGAYVHAITCSSDELTQLVKAYFPEKIVEHVPDRLDASIFPSARSRHSGTAKNIVWFGFIHNAHETLIQLLPAIRANNLSLTVISNRPYDNDDAVLQLQPDFIPYSQQTIYEQLKQFDFVLNPKSNRALFKYKSNNKSLISWKLGLPVATTGDEIEKLLDPEERNREVEKMQQTVNDNYLIGESAKQYINIIGEIKFRYF